MPFDAVSDLPLTDETDPLARLGIIPVPLSVAERHKITMLDDYACQSPDNAYCVAQGMTQWRTLVIGRTHLRRHLSRPYYRGTSVDLSGAPAELVKLAQFVRRRVREANFIIEYFDIDPILHVTYGGDRRACLGIWDHGKIVQIAQQQPSRWSRWLRSMRTLTRAEV